MIVGLAFAAGAGLGLVVGLGVALAVAYRGYLDLRDRRVIPNQAAQF